MARITHSFDFPDRFVAGTTGRPGERTFFIQAREDGRLLSVLCEKQQVQVLADHLERILDELIRMGSSGLPVPPAVASADDLDPLDVPIEEEFRVGTMTIAWDPDAHCVQIELFAMVDEDDVDPLADIVFGEEADGMAAREALCVRLTPVDARQFVARSRSLVSAGRPACPFCAQPINPGGHICPRSNGYRKPLFDLS